VRATTSPDPGEATRIHPRVEALVGLFRARAIHAARSGREVMRALAAVSADSSALELNSLLRDLEANMQAIIEALPAYAPPVNVLQRIQLELDRARAEGLSQENLRAAIAAAATAHQAWSEQARPKIASHALSLLAPGTTVFTFTLSETVLTTLRQAGTFRPPIRVIVTESRPNNDGLSTALSLAEIGIEVDLGLDGNLGDLIRRADLVMIGAEAILSDGSAICKVGTYPATLAAHRTGIPVYVLVDTQKFHSISLLGLETALDPIEGAGGVMIGHLFDRTPAALITGLVTEAGIFHPTQVSLRMMGMPLNEELASRIAHPRARAA
jgi:ribose 1,5-bisphosphate isomerase